MSDGISEENSKRRRSDRRERKKSQNWKNRLKRD